MPLSKSSSLFSVSCEADRGTSKQWPRKDYSVFIFSDRQNNESNTSYKGKQTRLYSLSSVENAFQDHHYHIDQSFTHQFVKGSSALLLVMQSVHCTFHFNHLLIMRPSMLLLTFPVFHYTEEGYGLQISRLKEVKVKAMANEGLTEPELTKTMTALSGNYTLSLLRSHTDSV